VKGIFAASTVRQEYPFLTINEAADIARISPKRLRKLMAAGVLVEGFHFTRPRHLRPRIIRAAFLAWLNGQDQVSVPLSRPQRHSRCKVDLSLIPGSNGERYGVQT